MSPGTRVTNGCELLCGCWDPNQHSSARAASALAVEPPLWLLLLPLGSCHVPLCNVCIHLPTPHTRLYVPKCTAQSKAHGRRREAGSHRCGWQLELRPAEEQQGAKAGSGTHGGARPLGMRLGRCAVQCRWWRPVLGGRRQRRVGNFQNVPTGQPVVSGEPSSISRYLLSAKAPRTGMC